MEIEKEIEIHLYGLAEGVADEPFTHNLLFAEAERAMLERNLHVQALDEVITDADTPLRFRVRFNPMKVRKGDTGRHAVCACGLCVLGSTSARVAALRSGGFHVGLRVRVFLF